jgi:hypothetical protein
MARQKETIWQRDFGLGAVRPEAVERDDTALVDQSTKEALNTITLTTGQIQQRPGSVHQGTTAASDHFEVDLGSGRQFTLYLTPTGYEIYDTSGALEDSDTATDWTAMPGQYGSVVFSDIQFWVVADPETSSILIGSRHFPIQALTVSDTGVWSFGAAAYEESLAGAINQPYYNYYPGVTIQPSARTGTITLTADPGIWTDDHEGLYIRYVNQTVLLGTRVSATVINATVIEELPPTFDLTVGSVSGYKVGDAVEHSVLGGTGIVTAIAGSVVTALVVSGFDGFTNSGKLVAPNAAQTITAKSDSSALGATFLWDIQMLSRVHGYAGWAARHKSRMYLCDFPSAPQAYAVSDAGFILAFALGPNDADGFIETIGIDRGGSLKFILSAEDLLFLTTRGLFYQSSRDGSPITPLTIGPSRFSSIGVSDVRPVSVDDGAIFIDSAGQQVWAAVLTGDVYKSWRAQMITKFHSHLVSSPVYIGATTAGSENPEQFIYVINGDGGAAVCQWDRDEGKISWRPWVTDGSYVAMNQIFGKTELIVDRVIDGVSTRFRERLFNEAYLDCMAGVEVSSSFLQGQAGQSYFGGTTAFATHLEGETASVYFEGWDYGDLVINADGKPLDFDGNVFDYVDYDGIAQVGLNFRVRVKPWARRSVNTQRGTREIKRLIEMYVTVRSSGPIEIGGAEFGDYKIGEDLLLPPPLRDQQYRIGFAGGDSFGSEAIERVRPGPVQLLKLGYRVVI